jgi:hypothetical protein
MTKQTAVIIAVSMILYALWTDWRRAMGMAIAFVAAITKSRTAVRSTTVGICLTR